MAPRGSTIRRVDLPALLADLTHVPHLDGAACIDHPQLFDQTIGGTAARPEVAAARRDAVKICREQCPCLAECDRWVSSLEPNQRPMSVVAGHINFHDQPRPPGTPDTRTHW